ncbi:unnamed protein product [Trichobilharzia regenti]|nr:unnamed protein product [Trichobilharzia regenti]
MKQAQIECDGIQETLQEQMNKLEETDKRATNVSFAMLFKKTCLCYCHALIFFG